MPLTLDPLCYALSASADFFRDVSTVTVTTRGLSVFQIYTDIYEIKKSELTRMFHDALVNQ